jgi:asparagine synthase (glutamine-hydrolysing)
MSVQFGKCNLDGKPVDPKDLDRVRPLLASFGPDGEGCTCRDNVGVLYRAFCTTKESHLEVQPEVSPSGLIITWDGRLDNRQELMSEVGRGLTASSTDAAVAIVAYERWQTGSFARLIGDWALSVWNPRDRVLVLARDPIGARHLYYSFENDQVTWSTLLDPLVLFAGKTFTICEEYVAGWFAFLPAVHLTPYVGIDAVPPSSFVMFRPGRRTVSKYWDFDPSKKIRYRRDAEYEEHFRTVFATAVRRRLRSDRPILAELSGGMDSSSIVCMADALIAQGHAQTPRLDTISYYDDSEPNWDDRDYFTKIEQKRGRIGFHIDCAAQESVTDPPLQRCQPSTYRLVPTPVHDDHTSLLIGMCLASQGNRIVLSGIGGDEVMGGVPTPIPELQDLLAGIHLRSFARQLKIWALQRRRPWFHLLQESARGFFPPALVRLPKDVRPVPWLQSKFVKRQWAALTGYPSRIRLFGPVPSLQDNLSTLDGLRRLLASKVLEIEPLYEKRYPYLDRDLLEFMFAVPRQQSVRPRQRRSLMRRALLGIVPDEILGRKRKAFVVRAPLVAISRDWVHLAEMSQHLLTGSLGIVDAKRFLSALQKARCGEDPSSFRLMRTIYMEYWLRSVLRSGIANLDRNAETELVYRASLPETGVDHV